MSNPSKIAILYNTPKRVSEDQQEIVLANGYSFFLRCDLIDVPEDHDTFDDPADTSLMDAMDKAVFIDESEGLLNTIPVYRS